MSVLPPQTILHQWPKDITTRWPNISHVPCMSSPDSCKILFLQTQRGPKRIAKIELRVVGIKLHLLLSDSKIDLSSGWPTTPCLQFHFYFQASTVSSCRRCTAAWHAGTAESDYRRQAGQSNQSRALATVLATEVKTLHERLQLDGTNYV